MDEASGDNQQDEGLDLTFENAILARQLVDSGYNERAARTIAGLYQEYQELDRDLEESRALDNGPTEEKKCKTEEFETQTRRFPELAMDVEIPSNLHAKLKKEKLPGTQEEDLAYMIYRSAGLNPPDATSFAKGGFLFDSYTSSYVPSDVAKKVCDALYPMKTGVDLEETLSHMREFIVTDLPKHVFEFGNPEDFINASFVRKLPPEAKSIVWGSYLNEASTYIHSTSQ